MRIMLSIPNPRTFKGGLTVVAFNPIFRPELVLVFYNRWEGFRSLVRFEKIPADKTVIAFKDKSLKKLFHLNYIKI